MTRVLVAYGSKHGGSAGIAMAVGDELRLQGVDAFVVPASDVGALTDFEAIVLGGALYLGRWHADAVALARRVRHEVPDVPLWLFSSGPVTGSVSADWPETPSVDEATAMLNIRGQRTFGGRLRLSGLGPFERLVIHAPEGDWRSFDDVRAWARQIARQLARAPVPALD